MDIESTYSWLVVGVNDDKGVDVFHILDLDFAAMEETPEGGISIPDFIAEKPTLAVSEGWFPVRLKPKEAHFKVADTANALGLFQSSSYTQEVAIMSGGLGEKKSRNTPLTEKNRLPSFQGAPQLVSANVENN